MKKLFLLFLLIPFLVQAEISQPPIKYGEISTVSFVLYNTDGTLDVDEVDGGAEVSLYCNNGAPATATNDFVDEGTWYSLALTAAETACARVGISVAATDLNVFSVSTFGHPSARIISYDPVKAADLVDAAGTTTTLELAAGDSAADDFYNDYWGQIVAGTGLGQEFTITDYANTGNVATITTLVTNTSTDSYYIIYAEKKAVFNIAAGVVEAKAMSTATDAFTATSFAVDSIGASEIAADFTTEVMASLAFDSGTCDSGSTTTCVDAAAFTTADTDYYAKGFAILFTSGTLDKQSACIYDFDTATDTVKFRPALTQAVSTHTYILLSHPTCGGVVAP